MTGIFIAAGARSLIESKEEVGEIGELGFFGYVFTTRKI